MSKTISSTLSSRILSLTRGTKGAAAYEGGSLTGDNYTKSLTLLLHGYRKQWVGNVCFMDNHTTTIETFYPQLTAYEATDNDRDVKDNIFDAEFEDVLDPPNTPDNAKGHASNDAFLVICLAADEHWCLNRYDPLLP